MITNLKHLQQISSIVIGNLHYHGFAHKEGLKEALEARLLWSSVRWGLDRCVGSCDELIKEYTYPLGAIEMPWGVYVKP